MLKGLLPPFHHLVFVGIAVVDIFLKFYNKKLTNKFFLTYHY